MTNRRPKATARLLEESRSKKVDSPSATMASPSMAPPADDNGRMALVLASFALAVATFLIVLVAIAASNA